MQELIKVNKNDNGKETVNARELHKFLEVGKIFGAWINDRINQYGFVENEDYVVVSENGNNPLGGRPSKDYHIAIDMAKELSMIERNEKGKEARQYFIDRDNKLSKVESAVQLPQNYLFRIGRSLR